MTRNILIISERVRDRIFHLPATSHGKNNNPRKMGERNYDYKKKKPDAYTEFGHGIYWSKPKTNMPITTTDSTWTLIPDEIVQATHKGDLVCGICIDDSPVMDTITICCKRTIHRTCLEHCRKCPYCRSTDYQPKIVVENWT